MANHYNCTHDAVLEFQIESMLYHCAKNWVSLLLIIILKPLLCGNNSLLANPSLKFAEVIKIFTKYCDWCRFMHFMMGFRNDFKSIWASLLHRSSTPSFDVVVKWLISKENCHSTYHMSSAKVSLATPPATSTTTSGRPASKLTSQLASRILWRVSTEPDPDTQDYKIKK